MKKVGRTEGEFVRELCTNCEKQTKLELESNEEVIEVRREPITVQVQYLKCTECGDEVFNPELDNDPFDSAYREYRRRHGLLQPEEIRDWRKAYDLSQIDVAKLLGLGGATISRYENGALQDESHDRLLRLAMKPENLLRLIEKSENAISESKRRNLMKSLKEAEANAYSIDLSIVVNFGRYEADEYSGYRELSLDKLYNAILFFSRDGVFKTKLNKLLFYADFKHFKDYTVSITGTRYARVPFGPAPDNFSIYYAALSAKSAIAIVEWEGTCKENGEKIEGEILKAIWKPDINLFSDSEIRVMAIVKEELSRFSAGEISDMSHKEVGYKMTKQGKLISYTYAGQLSY